MNLATRITMVRIFLIPVMVFLYLADFIPYGKLIAFAIFVIAALTDLIDGYIARKYNQVTTIGGFMDTIADKVLTASALLLIVADATILAPYGVIAAIIIIGREFIISALKMIGASKNVVIMADKLGKWKATFQMVSIGGFMLVAGLIGVIPAEAVNILNYISLGLLGVAILFTIVSGVNYCVKNRQVFK